MRKYPVTTSDGNIYNMYHIGVNHAHGLSYGGMISSYKEILDNEDEVKIESGIGEQRYCTIGNIKEAYEILKKHLIDKRPETLFEYAYCVQKTVLDYFGGYSNIKKRLSYFPDEEEVNSGIKIGTVSSMAHQNAAMCVERAMLSHNLLKSLKIDSTFKMSGFMVNGKSDSHAYNLLASNGKYYLFDATIPTLRDNTISPIICEIPKDTYDKISSPLQDIGESVHIIHYNPLQDKDYDVIYDAGRKNVYEVTSSFIK